MTSVRNYIFWDPVKMENMEGEQSCGFQSLGTLRQCYKVGSLGETINDGKYNCVTC